MDWIRVAGVLGFVGVAFGAFGAHMLKARLTPEMMSTWNTGVLYHLVHTLALFAISLVGRRAQIDVNAGSWFFLLGIVIFSGSLYALCLSGFRMLGAVTPLGGFCFLLGWGWVAWKLSSRL